MARPRRYTTDTQRRQAHAQSQRAYRRRQREATVPVDRSAMAALLAAVDAAAAAGDPLARRLRPATADGLLRNLAHLFRLRATTLDARSSSGQNEEESAGSDQCAGPRDRVT